MLDLSTEFGQRADKRLRDDTIIWLTTVRPTGMPEPSPVWFLWDGQTVLVYSQPNTQKLRDIARNPNIALHFDSDGRGGNIVIRTGEAEIDQSLPPATAVPEYLKKYQSGIAGIGMTPEQFAKGFSVPIRIRPIKVRGH